MPLTINTQQVYDIQARCKKNGIEATATAIETIIATANQVERETQDAMLAEGQPSGINYVD